MNVGTRYNGMEAVARKGGSFFLKKHNNSNTPEHYKQPLPLTPPPKGGE